jgi:hypothetical protein
MDGMVEAFEQHLTAIANQLDRDGFFEGVYERDLIHSNDQAFLSKILKKELSRREVPTTLYELTRILRIRNAQDVVLLVVDEYDTLTWHAVQNGYFPEVCTLQTEHHGLEFSWHSLGQ